MDWPTGSDGLDAGTRLWVESVANAYGWALLGWALAVTFLLLLVALLVVPSVRRRFWCSRSQREVEVVFEECGLPGRRRRTAVLSCTAFDPPTDIRCGRSCLEPGAVLALPGSAPAGHEPSIDPS
jgi:hypothetical protein